MLSPALARAFARVALANVVREYPRRLDQLLTAPDIEWRPRMLHPAFFGSYDWHSAVHMHWLLVRLLRLHPFLEGEAAPTLDTHLSPARIAQELAFFRTPGGATFERPYGWAWLLELQAECLRAGRWHSALAPLADELSRRFVRCVTALPYPIRAGTHGNSAFACLLALDYARGAGDEELLRSIDESARRWFLADRNYPAHYEPSGDDFLSPALCEAVLMREVLTAEEYGEWRSTFLPADLGPLFTPPAGYDRTDAKQSHLDGLCLSRAWCFLRLGLPELAGPHLEAALPYVVGGDYVGEHWLASFATLALSEEASKSP